MKRLTNGQILATLDLSDIYPLVIASTMVQTYNHRDKITVSAKTDAKQKHIEACVVSVFPDVTFEQYVTCEHAYSIILNGNSIGSYHMKLDEEKLPAPTESNEETIPLNDTIFDAIEEEKLVGIS